MSSPWAYLRDLRYALPGAIERHVSGPDAASASRLCDRLHRQGLASSIGYFQAGNATPDAIVAANVAACRALGDRAADCYLSVKAPPLACDRQRVNVIAQAALAAGLPIVFDAHAPKDATATLALVEMLLADYPGTGFALPARWLRSADDVRHFRDSTARIRLVKGEWADPAWHCDDLDARYLALVTMLAGRRAPVAIATHDPALAEKALAILTHSGTPCELEQLRGLPRRRTSAVAATLGVPVRVYAPFGPGWWPYAVDKALARPYLASWMVRDALGWR